jgi:thioredoxin-related protein
MLNGITTPTVFAQQEAQWHAFGEALSIAAAEQRPIFVDVSAPWCGWCRKMRRDVYPELMPELGSDFVLTRLNRDDNETMHRFMGSMLSSVRLAQQLNIQSVPAIVLLDSEGEYILHLSGFIEADKLQPVINYISTGAYKRQSFERFRSQNFR